MELPSDVAAWLEERLPGNYSLEGWCGSGGMGVVFRILHKGWGIPLALKLPKTAQNPNDAEQFMEETELWADLGLHPYVTTLYYTRILEGRCCTFAELVEGGGLDRILRERGHRGADEEITLSRILSLAASTAWGLNAAHRHGMVHCDFKPGNVLVTPGFTAKITDFGLARRNNNGSFACPGRTPLYASPEQSRGEDLTEATDFWSWGATCFEMFLEGVSWQGGAAASGALEDYVDSGAKFPGLPQMPRKLVGILRSCLKINPRDRPSSFEQIGEELCALHESLLGEPCFSPKPEGALLEADSLNNRAVSLLDLEQESRAGELLQQALEVDPYHPEAIHNLYVVLEGRDRQSLMKAETLLLKSAKLDAFNSVPCELLATLYLRLGRVEEASRFQKLSLDRAGDGALGSKGSILAPVLAKPISGEQNFFNRERFFRLLEKGEVSFLEGDSENARRYVLMAGDIPGFARHPSLHKLRRQLEP